MNKIGVVLGLLILVIVSIDILSREEISEKNTVSIDGTFRSLEKDIPKNGDVSYNISIQGNNRLYKILPDWVNCFDYPSFRKNVSEGDSITLVINKDKGQRSEDVEEVVSLISNKHNFISTTCINKKNHTSKIITILIWFIITGSAIYFIIRKKA